MGGSGARQRGKERRRLRKALGLAPRQRRILDSPTPDAIEASLRAQGFTPRREFLATRPEVAG